MCNHENEHGEDATLFIKELPGEVYICTICGGIFDWANKKNFSGCEKPMTKDELIEMIDFIVHPYKDLVEKLRDAIRDLDSL